MKLIPLSRKQFAKVNDERYDHLMQWKWHARWNEKTQSYYAARNQNLGLLGEPWINSFVSMHRYILGLKTGDGKQGDHIDGDTLNNCDDNLRVVTSSQNAINRKTTVANTSGCKGVGWRKDINKGKGGWYAYIKINRVMMSLGFYDDFEEAVRVRKEAEKQYFGEYATDR